MPVYSLLPYAYMSTATLPREINGEVKSWVVQAVHDVLNDPDFNLELTKHAKARLKKAGRIRQTIPFSEIKKKHY